MSKKIGINDLMSPLSELNTTLFESNDVHQCAYFSYIKTLTLFYLIFCNFCLEIVGRENINLKV